MVLAKEDDFRGVNRALLMTQPYGIVFADRRPVSRCRTATTANIFVQTKYGNFPSAQMSKQI